MYVIVSLNLYKIQTKKYIHFFFKTASLVLLSLAFSQICFSQESINDSTNKNSAADNLVADYKNALKENLRLYNGKEYQFSGHNANGFPFFQSVNVLNGSVLYDDNLYTNIPLYYDLVNEAVVTKDYTNNFPVQLISGKIKYFIIDGHKFVNAAVDDNFPVTSVKGFYEELYNGKAIAFAKKQKTIRQRASSEGTETSYKEYDSYFVYFNNQVYKVNNEKSLLDVFNDKRADLKKFISTNNINFRKNFENALVSVTRYFDQISN